MNAKVCLHNIQLSPFHVQRHKNGELLQKESSIPDNTSERGTAFIQVSLFSGWRTWCLSSFSSSSYYNSRWYVLCIIFSMLNLPHCMFYKPLQFTICDSCYPDHSAVACPASAFTMPIQVFFNFKVFATLPQIICIFQPYRISRIFC